MKLVAIINGQPALEAESDFRTDVAVVTVLRHDLMAGANTSPSALSVMVSRLRAWAESTGQALQIERIGEWALSAD